MVRISAARAIESPAPAAGPGNAEKGTALYVAMPRPFVFNVPGSGRDRLVQIKVQLLVRGSDNEELALFSGSDPKRVVMITWMIAGILATIGGVLYGLDKSFKPFTYFNNMLPIFAAAIVGGIGNPFGAFLGGYVIAFSEILVTYAYRKFFIYLLPESIEPDSLLQLLSTDYKFAVSFSILVVVLLFRPSGIFKGKVL